jgi:hypothetical protein
MKIRIEPTKSDNPYCQHPTVEISIPNDMPNISQMFEELIEPALLAAGFGRETIDNYYNSLEF